MHARSTAGQVGSNGETLTIWGYYTSEIGITQELQQLPAAGRRRLRAMRAVAPPRSHMPGTSARGTHAAE
jgi:hypothetical protein